MSRRKIAIGLGAAAGVVVLLLLLLHAPPVRRLVWSQLQAAVRDAARIEVEARDFRYNLLRGSVEASGLSLRAAGKPSQPPFLEASGVSIHLGLWESLHGYPLVEQAKTESLQVRILVTAGGENNLPAQDATARSPIGLLPDFLVRTLSISGASFEYDDQQAGTALRIPRWRMAVSGQGVSRHDIDVSAEPGSLRLAGQSIAIDTLRLRAHLRPGFVEVRELALGAGANTLTAAGRMDDFDKLLLKLSGRLQLDLAPAARLAGLREPFAGVVAAMWKAEGPAAALRLSARLSGTGLVLAGLPPGQLGADARLDLGAQRLELPRLEWRSAAGWLRVSAAGPLSEAGGTGRGNVRFERVNLGLLARRFALPVQPGALASGDAVLRWPGLRWRQASGSARLRLVASGEAAPGRLPVSGTLVATAEGGAVNAVITALRAAEVEVNGEAGVADLSRLSGRLRVQAPSLGASLQQTSRVFSPSQALPGTHRVDGALDAELLLAGTVSQPEVSISLAARSLRAGQLRDGALTAQASVSPQRARLETLRLEWQGQSLSASGAVQLDGDEQPVSGELQVRGAALKPLLEGLGSGLDAEGAFDMTARFQGPLRSPDAVLQLRAFGLKALGEPLGELELNARMQGGAVLLERLELRKSGPQGGSIHAEGVYRPGDRTYQLRAGSAGYTIHRLRLDSGNFAGGVLSFSASGSGRVDDPELNLEARIGNLRLEQRELGEVQAVALLRGGQGTVRLQAPRFGLDVDAGVGTKTPYPARVNARVEDLDLSRLATALQLGEPLRGSIRAVLRAEGELASWPDAAVSLEIPQASAVIRNQQLRLTAPLEISAAGGAVAIRRLAVASGASSVEVSGAFPWRKGRPPGDVRLNATLDLAGLQGWLPGEGDWTAEGKLSLSGHVRGTPERLEPDLALSADGVLLSGKALAQPLRVNSLEAVLREGSVVLRELAASLGGARLRGTAVAPLALLSPGVELPLQRASGPGRFRFELSDFDSSLLSNAPAGVVVQAGVVVEGAAARVDDWRALEARATFGTLRIRSGDYSAEQAGPASLLLRNGVAVVESFRLKGPAAEMELRGTAELAPGGALDARASGTLSLELLRLFSPDIRTSGDCRFELAAGGALSKPSLSGQLEISDGLAAIPAARLQADSVSAKLAFRPGVVSLERLSGALNGGTLEASGTLAYEGTEPTAVQLRLETKGAYFNLPEGLRSRAEARLELRSEEQGYGLGGAIRVLEGSYRDPLELETQLLAYLQQDRGVVLGQEPNRFLSKLRFNLPIATDGPLAVDNNLARIALQADLRLVGTYYRPALTGRIVVEEGGQLYLSEKTYTVERGVVSFLNERRIEPQLDIVARTRAGRYDVSLNVSGKPGDFKTNLRSDPELPEADIVSLLVTGRTLDETRGAEMNVAREQALSYLAGRVGGRLSRGAEQALGLTTVRIEPNLIAAESNPGARLTLGQDITTFLRFIYSMNLANSSDQIYIAEYDVTRRFNTRAVRQADNTYRFEFRHDLRFGGARDTGRQAASPAGRKQLGWIRFRGDSGFPQERLAGVFDLQPGQRYDFFAVQKGIERLERFYAARGRLEARVRVRRVTEGERVHLDAAVEGGPQVNFVYEGAEPSRGVRNAVRKQWREGIFDAQRLEDATAVLRDWLAREGYLNPSIRHRVETPSPGVKRIVFSLQPGTRYQDVPVVFEGAKFFTPKELVELLKQAKLWEAVRLDPRKVSEFLRRYYQDQGFLDAEAGAPRLIPHAEGGARLLIPIREGPRFVIGDLRVEGNRALTDAEVLGEVPAIPGIPYRPLLLSRALEVIEERYWRDGYNRVEVSYVLRRNSGEGSVDLTFQVVEGPQQVVKEVAVDGTHSTSEKFVRQQLELSGGDILRYERTNQSRQNLYNTGAFSLVDIESRPVEEAAPGGIARQPVVLDIKVREVKPFELRYGAFYDTDRGPGLIADFATRNQLGPARVLGVRTRYDSDVRELRGYFSQPLLRNLPVRTNLIGFFRRELFTDFITDRTGYSLQQEVELRNRFVISYGYRWERNDTFDRDPDSPFQVPPIDVAPLTLSVTRETRDDLIDATRGSLFTNAFEYASRKLGSDLRFVRYFGQYFKYLPLTPPVEVPWTGQKRSRLVFATGVRLGLGRGLGGQDLIRSERFYAGGGTSMRGFQQDTLGPKDFLGAPTGGNAMFIANHELRFPLYSIFDGVGFLDLGNLFAKVEDFRPWDVRKVGGLGLRVRTPYFLLRFDYGRKFDRLVGESAGQFFFSIGQAF